MPPTHRSLPTEIVNDKGHYRQHRIRVSLGNLNLFDSRARPQRLDGSGSKAFAFRSRSRHQASCFASIRERGGCADL